MKITIEIPEAIAARVSAAFDGDIEKGLLDFIERVTIQHEAELAMRAAVESSREQIKLGKVSDGKSETGIGAVG